MAECVLYYYLTKKNENYKSLVRRSYRRRGKGQVRGGRRAVGPWGQFPACSAALPSCGFRSGVAGTPLLGMRGLPQQRRTELGGMAALFSAWKILELSLVTPGPCG